jgi:hypothetical protein
MAVPSLMGTHRLGQGLGSCKHAPKDLPQIRWNSSPQREVVIVLNVGGDLAASIFEMLEHGLGWVIGATKFKVFKDLNMTGSHSSDCLLFQFGLNAFVEAVLVKLLFEQADG